MFRFYHTFDLNSEIEKELLRASHLAQILIDEIDLFMLSKTLFKAIDNGVFIEIVIVSESNNKSMKLVNLCKRLIDQEVSIYWKLDEKLLTKKDFFAIFDNASSVIQPFRHEISSGLPILYLCFVSIDFTNVLASNRESKVPVSNHIVPLPNKLTFNSFLSR